MAHETMEPKTYSIEEVLAITIKGLEELWGNIPMRFKEMLADPLSGNIGNLRGCYNAIMQTKAEREEKPEIDVSKPIASDLVANIVELEAGKPDD